MLAVANSVWTLFDFEKGVPTRVTPEIIAAYPVENKIEMDYQDRKIAIPEGESYSSEEIVVRKHHLDTNNHVNNGQYIRMALESLSDKNRNVVSLRAEYKKQALLGDVLYPVVIKSNMGDNKVYTVSLNDKDKEPVCVVQIKVD